MSKINNITELRKSLLEHYEALSRDPKRLNQCAELSNTAGKVLATAKLQLDGAASVGVQPPADCLEFLQIDKPEPKRIESK